MKSDEKVAVTYTKPIILAQNKSAGSFAAGCPDHYKGGANCRHCDRAS